MIKAIAMSIIKSVNIKMIMIAGIIVLATINLLILNIKNDHHHHQHYHSNNNNNIINNNNNKNNL